MTFHPVVTRLASGFSRIESAITPPAESEETTVAEGSADCDSRPVDSAFQFRAQPNLTSAQQDALRFAEQYLDLCGFSRQGLIDQLTSEHGNHYAVEDATFAVDKLNVDWNEQAVRTAKSYLETSSLSYQGLIDLLSSEYGDRFSAEEATYGAQALAAL